MKLNNFFLTAGLFFAFTFSTNSQLHYNVIELGKTLHSGYPLSSADINGDHLPDLISTHNATEIWIGYNTGTLQFLWEKLGDTESFIWSINVADLDNNSYNDVIVSGESFGIIVYYQNQIGFARSYLDSALFFSQAATLFDVDADSYLDFTICDEFAKTRFYKNTGNKIFQLDTQLINLRLNENDGEAGNYGCIWSDLDGDRDPDLYISRCRPDIKDSTDRRRRNLFYHNDQGNFIEEGELRNIGILDQSWVSDIGDLDGDGLQDLVVLNHYSSCNIFRQIAANHHFENITSQSGFNYKGTPIQLSLQDFDNDMDLDILIAGDNCEIWLNDGSMQFTRADEFFSNHAISSFCIADFNQDGMLEFCASFADLINAPSIVRDRLFVAEKNTNNYIGFMLQGMQSNRNGIGTQLKVYVNGIMQLRELRCGESFGIQNSHQLHFGLGSNDIVDSLIVLWPGGNVNRFYNIQSNDYYLITENNCYNKRIEIYPGNKAALCDTATLELKALSGLNNILWSSGERTEDLHITKNGIYFYHAFDSANCPVISSSLNVEYNPVEFPKLNSSGLQILCNDEELELYIENYEDVIWNDNSTNSVRNINESGIYFVSAKGSCDYFLSDTLIVEKKAALSTPRIRDTTILIPASVILDSDQDNTKWFNNATDTDPVFIGKKYITPIITKTTQMWAEAFEKYSYPVIHTGIPEPKYNFSPFHTHTLNGGLYFNVEQDCILESVVVYTDRSGTRRILLQDENLNTLDSMEFELNPGLNLLQLNFSLSKTLTKYYLTTSSSINKQQFLSISPWLFRSEIDFSYPIRVNDVCNILYSGSGESEYQYFFDWKIKLLDKECSSNRIPVNIVVENISTDELFSSLWDQIEYRDKTIYFKKNSELEYLVISDIHGKACFSQKNYHTQPIRMNQVSSGLYFIQFKSKNSNKPVHGKILVE